MGKDILNILADTQNITVSSGSDNLDGFGLVLDARTEYLTLQPSQDIRINFDGDATATVGLLVKANEVVELSQSEIQEANLIAVGADADVHVVQYARTELVPPPAE
jgi:hypothetical protein